MLVSWMLLFTLCYGLQVEVNLGGHFNSHEKKVKLICIPSPKMLHTKRKQNIRDSKSTIIKTVRKHDSLPTMHNEILLPRMMVNSSAGMKCFLENLNTELLKKRSHRELDVATHASVPVENGNCPPGHRIDQDRCFPCFPGSYTSGQETECFLCPKDFYMDKEAADSCWPCPKGMKTLAEGADSVDACIDVDDKSLVNTTFSSAWTVVTICVIVFLILSWILIAFLVARIFHWRRWRKTLKKDALINYSEKDNKIEIEKQKMSRKKTINENTSDKHLENIKEEVSSQTDLEDFQSHLNPKDISKKQYLDGTCRINSPAKNNYFFINQNPDSNAINRNLPFRKNNRIKSKIRSFMIRTSESDSDSDLTYGSAKESVTDTESLFTDASTKDRTFWFKEEKRELSLENQNTVHSMEKEELVKSLNDNPAVDNILIEEKVEDPLLKLNSREEEVEDLLLKLNSSIVDLSKVVPWENNLKVENIDMGKDLIAEPLTNSEIQPTSETEHGTQNVSCKQLDLNQLKRKSNGSLEILRTTSYEKANSLRSGNYTLKSFKQTSRNWIYYPPLCTPQFHDVLNFRSNSRNEFFRNKIESGFCTAKQAVIERGKILSPKSSLASQVPDETRVIIEPDVQNDERTICKDIASSSDTDSSNHNACPLHDFNPLRPVACHVDFCVEFLM